MRLLIVRHGHAVEREEFATLGKNDRLRPLSKRGEKRTPLIAQGLKLIEPKLALVLSSPYLRCMQTAKIIAQVYGDTPIQQTDALRPSASIQAILAVICGGSAKGVTCLVGHEPQLSLFISQLLAKSSKALLELKKGGACLVEMTPSRKDEAKLICCLTPRQLTALGQK